MFGLFKPDDEVQVIRGGPTKKWRDLTRLEFFNAVAVTTILAAAMLWGTIWMAFELPGWLVWPAALLIVLVTVWYVRFCISAFHEIRRRRGGN